MSIDAMKQALAALATCQVAYPGTRFKSKDFAESTVQDAITALRTAIEQAEKQEPVAWREFDGEGGYDYRSYDDNENFRDEYIKRNGAKYADWVEPLYTAPPQRQPLTDNSIAAIATEINGSCHYDDIQLARAVERKHGIGGEHG